MGEGGFEPPKRDATDLQSAPFGHSGTLPSIVSWWTDLNPRPADYKSAALPPELHQQINRLIGLPVTSLFIIPQAMRFVNPFSANRHIVQNLVNKLYIITKGTMLHNKREMRLLCISRCLKPVFIHMNALFQSALTRRNSAGSQFRPLTRTSKCRCGPVE